MTLIKEFSTSCHDRFDYQSRTWPRCPRHPAHSLKTNPVFGTQWPRFGFNRAKTRELPRRRLFFILLFRASIMHNASIGQSFDIRSRFLTARGRLFISGFGRVTRPTAKKTSCARIEARTKKLDQSQASNCAVTRLSFPITWAFLSPRQSSQPGLRARVLEHLFTHATPLADMKHVRNTAFFDSSSPPENLCTVWARWSPLCIFRSLSLSEWLGAKMQAGLLGTRYINHEHIQKSSILISLSHPMRCSKVDCWCIKGRWGDEWLTRKRLEYSMMQKWEIKSHMFTVWLFRSRVMVYLSIMTSGEREREAKQRFLSRPICRGELNANRTRFFTELNIWKCTGLIHSKLACRRQTQSILLAV